MSSMSSPGSGGMELLGRVEALEQKGKYLTIPLASITNASIKEYLKANLKNGCCIPFMFNKLTDNPFSQLIYGYGIAFYYRELSGAAWIIAHNGKITECTQVSLT